MQPSLNRARMGDVHAELCAMFTSHAPPSHSEDGQIPTLYTLGLQLPPEKMVGVDLGGLTF